MLKPNRTETAAQAENLTPPETGNLSATDQKEVRAVVRQLLQDPKSGYASGDYPDPASKISAVVGYDAQQILAALVRIEALDQDMDKLQIQGLLTSEENNDRLGWAAFILSVLYDAPEVPESTASGALEDSTIGHWCGRCGALTCMCDGVWRYC